MAAIDIDIIRAAAARADLAIEALHFVVEVYASSDDTEKQYASYASDHICPPIQSVSPYGGSH